MSSARPRAPAAFSIPRLKMTTTSWMAVVSEISMAISGRELDGFRGGRQQDGCTSGVIQAASRARSPRKQDRDDDGGGPGRSVR